MCAQVFTDDCYAPTHQAQTDLQSFENNFAALKSSFSGATAPPNPIAGMWWLDTTAHILKHRNEANNEWQDVWNMANNKPVVTNNISADFGAALKDAAAATPSLRTLGTGVQQAAAGNQSPPDGSVTTAKLKTATGTWNILIGIDTWAKVLLVDYSFIPKQRAETNVGIWARGYPSLTVEEYALIASTGGGASGRWFGTYRYITASEQTIDLMIDPLTREILGVHITEKGNEGSMKSYKEEIVGGQKKLIEIPTLKETLDINNAPEFFDKKTKQVKYKIEEIKELIALKKPKKV